MTDGSGPTGLRGNLRKAQELLAKAGWTVRDGLLRNAQGSALEFEILLVSSSDEKVALEFARALQTNWGHGQSADGGQRAVSGAA